jgi:signal peptidase
MSPRIHFWLRGAILAILAAGLCALVWPRPLGGQVSYVMVSGTSMQPKLHTDDLVVVRRRPHGYTKGDVIAYRIPAGEPGAGAQVIHRVIGVTASTAT